jgi:hypothetical protein
MPPCIKKWPDKKTSLTFTPEGRRPQSFFPPVNTLPIHALSLLHRSTVIAMHRLCGASLLYDLSVPRSDKNVVFFIHKSNQHLTVE